MDVQAAAPPQVVSSTRQCVCGGWTRYVVCQYCGTTDPLAAAAGLVSITPLTQLTPEQAVAHSAQVAQASPALPGWGDDGAPYAAYADSPPALPPTTFAEAQFGAIPSAAAVFASTAEPTRTGTPTSYAEPIPGWTEPPVAAPSGWSTMPTAPPIETAYVEAPYHEQPQLPSNVSAFEMPTDAIPAFGAPAFGAAPDVPVAESLPPAQYDAVAYDAAPAYPVSALTASGAAAPWPDPVIPTATPAEGTDQAAPADAGRRSLPRWAIFAAAGVVVAAAGGAYLYTQSGSSSGASAPVAAHTLTVVAAAPSGWTASGPTKSLTGTAIAAADQLHLSAELAAAGVSTATVQTFDGPGSLTVTALTETAASHAQALTLSTQTRQAGLVPPSIVRGSIVITLRAPSDAAGYATALPGWAARLRA